MTEIAALNPDALLDARGLKVHFPIKRGLWRRTVGYVKAVDDVSLHILEARRWRWWGRVDAARQP